MNNLFTFIFAVFFSITVHAEALPFNLKFGMGGDEVKARLSVLANNLSKESTSELVYSLPPTEIGEVNHIKIHFIDGFFMWMETPLTGVKDGIYKVKLANLLANLKNKLPPGFTYKEYSTGVYVVDSIDQISVFDFRERRSDDGTIWVNSIVYGKKFSGEEMLSQYMKEKGINQ